MGSAPPPLLLPQILPESQRAALAVALAVASVVVAFLPCKAVGAGEGTAAAS